MNKLYSELIQVILLLFITIIIPKLDCSWQTEDQVNLRYKSKPDRILESQAFPLIRKKRGLEQWNNILWNKILTLVIKRRTERSKKYGLGLQILHQEMKRWVQFEVIRKQKGLDLDESDYEYIPVDEIATLSEDESSTEDTTNEESSFSTEEQSTTPTHSISTTKAVKAVKQTTKIALGQQTTTEIEVPLEPNPNNITPSQTKKSTILAFIYKDPELIDLCIDPVFDSVDTNLDNSEVLIFKGEKFYLMENLRYGSGNLVTSGKTKHILPGFDHHNFTSIVTIKEGPERGYIYAFYNDQSFMTWRPSGGYLKMHHTLFRKRSKSIILPKDGFSAALHNRNIENPLIVGFNGNQVYYYDLYENKFIKHNELSYDKTPERFPPNVTSATSLQNGFIYVFRDKQYCVREMNFESENPNEYCETWHDNKRFLGCHGQSRPPYSIINYNLNDKEKNSFRGDLCDDLNIKGITKAIDGTVFVFRDDKYWKINGFPYNIKFIGISLATDKWPGFTSNPDAVMIAQEGPLRGQIFEFRGQTYNHWSIDGVLKEEDKKLVKITAVLQNLDVSEPIAVGFGQDKLIYLSMSKNQLTITKKLDYSKVAENWPRNITSALLVSEEVIYLFKKNKYCIRKWKCAKKDNCCKKWLDSKTLFGCS